VRLAHAVVIGVGGLGCPAALGLARGGVGTLTLVDPDRVELSNLPRQLLHRDEDVGRLKVESAAAKLASRFPGTTVRQVAEAFAPANAEELLSGADFVIDATDGIAAKLLINDAAVRARRPFCYAGILGLGGQVMAIDPGKTPCLRCLFPGISDSGEYATCSQAGIVGPVAGIFGALQATLALAYLNGDSQCGQLLSYERGTDRWRVLKLGAIDRCAGCASIADQSPRPKGDVPQWAM
jgi:adenylyltransferase/sulfurtransferase